MTNFRANPAGWTDADPVAGEVTPRQLNIMDRGAAGAVDGTAGGLYSPALPIRINGSGLSTSALKDSMVRGVLARGAAGRYPLTFDDTTIADTALPQYIDTSADVYWNSVAVPGNAWLIYLVTTAAHGQVPGDGDEITVVSPIELPLGATIKQESPVLTVATIGLWALQRVGSPMYCKFRWRSSTSRWVRVSFSADIA